MSIRKLVSRKQLRVDYGIPYTPTHLRRLEEAKEFPNRVHLGKCRVAYIAQEVEEWIEDRIAKRGVTTPS